MVLQSFSPWEDSQTCLQRTRSLQAELVLGVTSRRCSGNGICSLYTRGSLHLEKTYCNYAAVKIESDLSGNLLFALQKNTMRKRTIQKFFSQPFFLIEEDFLIPKFVKDALSLNRTYIEQGNYLMYEFQDYYFIFFRNNSF